MSSPNTENRNSNSLIAPRPLGHAGRVGANSQAKRGGSRRPGTKSLWLLPSGSDQVGDSAVRRLPTADMGDARRPRKFMFSGRRFIAGSPRGADLDEVTSGTACMLLPALLLLASAVETPAPSAAAPITVTGHAWAPFISPMG